MHQIRVLSADDRTLDALQDRFGRRLQVGARSSILVTYLDTFDWRIFRAGYHLTAEAQKTNRILRWRSLMSGESYMLPLRRQITFAQDLPEGFLRAEIEPIVEVRAMLEMGSSRTERFPSKVVDDNGNTTVALTLEISTPLDLHRKPAGPEVKTITIQLLANQADDFRSIVDYHESSSSSEDAVSDTLRAVAALRDRQPGDYTSKPSVVSKPNQRSDKALRKILRHLLATLRNNVDGVLEDIDIEFLHDLRVATRRTRSALTQVKGVLPQATVDEFLPEFRWLGAVTGPCRDLDVNLFEMGGFRSHLEIEGTSLDPLLGLLLRTRNNEHRRVCRALRSARFWQLLEGWSQFLESPLGADPGPVLAAHSIIDVSRARILKAYRRMAKRGAKLTVDPPAEALHRLRIDAKKLRYLLEFFSGLYPKKVISRLVKELKQLQDILGGFNDMEIQQTRLAGLADTLMQDGTARSDTIFAMGRLADAMAARQEEYRKDFSSRFAVFSNRDSRKLYSSVFGKTGR